MSFRDLYEKLWLAHQIFLASWDGSKYRLFSETPVDYLLTEADRATTAWYQYEYLLGRSELFWDYVREQLGIEPGAEDNMARQLWAKWRTPLLERYLTTQILSRKIVNVPQWFDAEVSTNA